MDPSEHARPSLANSTARFSWLLGALLLTLALPPLLEVTRDDWPGLRLGISAVLVSSLYVLARNRLLFWIGIATVLPALALDWISLAIESRGLALASSIATSSFLLVVIVGIGDHLVRTQRVTTDTILGGICLYLLLGVLWASAFTGVELAQPGSLVERGLVLAHTAHDPYRYDQLLYYSFVTLTTLGYGDIVPTTNAARALATGEAVTGQLYVAILVARLVGLHIARPTGSPE